MLGAILGAVGSALIGKLLGGKKGNDNNAQTNPLSSLAYGAASSIASNAIGSAFNRSNSIALQNHQDMLQRRQQEWLFRNQYPLQVASMRAAGLNPALQGGSSAVVTAPMTTPSSMNTQGIDLSAISNMLKTESDIKVNEATARNIDENTKGQVISNEMKANELTYQLDGIITELENKKAQSGYFRSMSALNEVKMDEVKANIDQIHAAEKELLSRVDLNKQSERLTKYQADRYNELASSEIAKNFADAKYMSNHDIREGKELAARLQNIAIMNDKARAETALAEVNKDIEEYTLKMDKKYENANRITQIFGNIATGVVAGVGAVLGGKALVTGRTIVKGFGK